MPKLFPVWSTCGPGSLTKVKFGYPDYVYICATI